MNANTSSRASSPTRLAAVVALVFAASSPAFAQNTPAPGAGAMPPAREGNIYDYHDHQPTQAEIDSAEAAAGLRAPSSGSKTQIENEAEDSIAADKQSVEDFLEHSKVKR